MSGPLAWYGVLPGRFEVSQVKQHFEVQLGKMLQSAPRSSRDLRVPYVSVTAVRRGFLASGGIRYMYAGPDEVSKYSVRSGDLLVCEGGAGRGRCAIVPPFEESGPLIAQNHVHRVRARANKTGEPKYLRFVLDTAEATGWFDAISNAATIPALSRQKLAALPIPLPPLSEQRLIARYLDHADLRIAHAIQSKQRLVALLDERRRAAIQSLVTAGTDQVGEVKASGIEWLGAVPAHWEIRPAKFFFREVNERSSRGEEELLSVSHLTGVTPRAAKNVTMFMAASYVGHKLCRQGDIVINTMWAWMGALGVADQTGIVSPAYAVYRPLSGSALFPSYAGLLLRTQPYVDEYTCRSTGIQASRLRLYPDRFLSVPIVCPPPSEQREIVDRAETATRGLTTAIAAALGEVDYLIEYRTRLITDVVTGKRDVRAQAEGQPDVDPAVLATVLSAGTGAEAGQDEESEEIADAV
jgi:type I restriction enzyme S subunit